MIKTEAPPSLTPHPTPPQDATAAATTTTTTTGVCVPRTSPAHTLHLSSPAGVCGSQAVLSASSNVVEFQAVGCSLSAQGTEAHAPEQLTALGASTALLSLPGAGGQAGQQCGWAAQRGRRDQFPLGPRPLFPDTSTITTAAASRSQAAGKALPGPAFPFSETKCGEGAGGLALSQADTGGGRAQVQGPPPPPETKESGLDSWSNQSGDSFWRGPRGATSGLQNAPQRRTT